MTDPRTQATRTQMDTGGIGRTGASGWAFFVGILLFMVGVFNVIWGLAALRRPRPAAAIETSTRQPEPGFPAQRAFRTTT